MKKKLLVVGILFFIVSGFIYVLANEMLKSEENKYFSPVEARYVTENIIKNSQGYIYEYEYVFELEGERIFYHSNEQLSFEESTAICLKRTNNEEQYNENGFILKKEYEKNIIPFKGSVSFFSKVMKISIVYCVIIVISIIISLFKEKIQYKRLEEKKKIQQKKDKLWKEDINTIINHINYYYEDFSEKAKLLDSLSEIIKELDEFYKNSKEEKEYRENGLRKELENIIGLYIKNIEIDKRFQKKLITPETNQDFFENIERLVSYIDNEVSNLTKENNRLISKGFDNINSKAELSGEAIEYLAQRYNK